jgi:putative DNA primase/helicase
VETQAAQDAAAYLARFGLTLPAALDLGLGVDAGAGDGFAFRSRAFTMYPRVTVPLVSFGGVVHGLQGRDITGQCPGRWISLSNPEGARWGAYGVFRGHGGYGTTLVTEGPGDALTAVSVGYDALAIRGASLAASPELIAELGEGLRGSHVIVCGDNDTAGSGFSQRLATGLAPHGITVYTLAIPEGLGKGGDLTDWREAVGRDFAAELHAAVKAAQPMAIAEAAKQGEIMSARTGTDTVSADQGKDAAVILGALLERYGDSDAMNAHALVAWTEGRIRYAPGLGFFVWNGRVWERSDVKVRQEIHRMGAALVLAGKTHEARGFTMTSRIDDLMTELRSVPSVHVQLDDFDASRHLLSFRNGTVDLRTGDFRGHDKADLITYCLDLDYVRNACCPRWDAFLAEIFPTEPELPAYMRRMTGYGITGNIDEQCFAVLWGKGANGKSVFTDTLTSVFSRITVTTPFATFEDKQSGGIPNDLAALRGSRLVMASEGEAGKPMSEATIKRVTGKDRVTARFLRQEFFTFSPTFLIMLATNHKPKFKSQDEGLWRRVKLIPFTRYFAPSERDYDLDRKLLAEAEGIAAWAVRGAVEWYRDGLGEPKCIVDATKEYRATEDAMAGFFPGVIEPAGDEQRLSGADAFNRYLEWCEDENLPQRERWTRRAFYGYMEERGVTRRKMNTGIVLVGVRFAAPPSPITGPGIFGN